MTVARRTVYGWCADVCRALGRQTIVIPETFDRLADWFVERSR